MPAIPEPAQPLFRVNITFPKCTSSGLVDSGSAVTLCSSKLFTQLSSKQIFEKSEHVEIFKSAGGEPLLSLGCYSISFTIDNNKFRHTFHIISILQEECILGADYLRINKLIVDVSSNQLLTKERIPLIKMTPTDTRLPCFNISTTESEYKFDLNHLDEASRAIIEPTLNKYQHLFTSDIKKLGCTNLVQHKIEAEGPPLPAHHIDYQSQCAPKYENI